VACRLGETLKVYVSDCDGTLWGGAVSEEGAHGISFEAPHLALQAALGLGFGLELGAGLGLGSGSGLGLG
jgi:hypothetical protein